MKYNSPVVFPNFKAEAVRVSEITSIRTNRGSEAAGFWNRLDLLFSYVGIYCGNDVYRRILANICK